MKLFVGFNGRFQFKKSLIDNLTFRLHYQYTFAILCIAGLLTAAKQYLGDPIDCTVDGAPESKNEKEKVSKTKPISFIIRCVEDLLLDPGYLHPPISTHR